MKKTNNNNNNNNNGIFGVFDYISAHGCYPTSFFGFLFNG
jgi:hypothetical protein